MKLKNIWAVGEWGRGAGVSLLDPPLYGIILGLGLMHINEEVQSALTLASVLEDLAHSSCYQA